MLLRRKEKKQQNMELVTGLTVKTPAMRNGHIVWNCFWRCMVVFCLVTGAIGGFLSAFDIEYNLLLVLFFYLILSMFFSVLYATSRLWLRDIGYLAFFAIFVFAIANLRIYANSGLYVVVNTMLRYAQEFFSLPGVREYETQIDNAYLTVAVTAIFIGMVLIIILNIWLYSFMSIFWTLFLTFPFLFIPLYMKLSPGPVYMILLAAGYVAVLVFKSNGHYLTFAWEEPFHIKDKKKMQIAYTQDAGVFRQIGTRLLILSLCTVMLLQIFCPPARFEGRFQSDSFRETTADAIGNFLLMGFSGVYNHYASVGGLSGGKLGGVSSVRPDYMTDLVVSYTPYSNAPVYLKGYTGGRYGDNEWETIYPDGNGHYSGLFKEESLQFEAARLQQDIVAGNAYSAAGKMDIRNVGANPQYMYYPYYTVFSESSIEAKDSKQAILQGIPTNRSVQYTYYPKIRWDEKDGAKRPAEIGKSSLDPVYLEVPDKNRQVIAQMDREIGLDAGMTENEIVEAVTNYFEENIPYTLKPGATPDGEDFVNYFLTENRKGYCAHFASAATLIFRSMGIPARYVEGYAFSLETALDSELNQSRKYEDYYSGYSELGKSAVVDVEVTDAMAHAWVEIYVDGFGWKTVEVTPGNGDTSQEDDFWTAFTQMLQGRGNGNSSNDRNGGFGKIDLSRYSWVLYGIAGLVGAWILFGWTRIGWRRIRRYASCHQKNKREAVIASYADLCDIIRICQPEFERCRSHREQLNFVRARYYAAFDAETIRKQLEEITYSEHPADTDVLEKLLAWIRTVRGTIVKKQKLRKRLQLIKR